MFRSLSVDSATMGCHDADVSRDSETIINEKSARDLVIAPSSHNWLVLIADRFTLQPVRFRLCTMYATHTYTPLGGQIERADTRWFS